MSDAYQVCQPLLWDEAKGQDLKLSMFTLCLPPFQGHLGTAATLGKEAVTYTMMGKHRQHQLKKKKKSLFFLITETKQATPGSRVLLPTNSL